MKRLAIPIVALVVVGASYLLGWSEVLPVKKVTIDEKNQGIVKELNAKLAEGANPIIIGKPIARVDRRAVALRLRELIWVDDVRVRRNFLSGEVKVSVSPRAAIAQLDASQAITSANPSEASFLSTDLEIFYVPRAEVAKAAKSGDVDWLSLPTLLLGFDESALKEDVRLLIVALKDSGAEVESIAAPNREALRSWVRISGRELDISWGSVKELELKFEVMNRLLELKANKNVKRIDLSSPTSPIVSNNS
jgi:hypothetical protein